VERNVLLTGYCPNIANILALAEIAVHTSVAPEPFGRVLLEAMALRKPVVGSRAGAVPEIVVHGQTGFTFTPGNPEELAGHILDLLADPARARAFGDAGYQRLVSHFHVRANVERTTAVYEKLLG
jgi:glycosyltransferase involved in cell wall biosynthesis